ncbi:unknown [Streptomyces phage mu1/6]|uniref:hypothetical protein n=1 Tax=Streptomyces phage mu1/6 TaxID=370623 RepID=UPI0000D4F6B4|nr:hypothetical protein SPMV1_gp06 [Streptomyces phage mu1/6]ABD94171.1 unknown [Streptomyces phage mu1/6]
MPQAARHSVRARPHNARAIPLMRAMFGCSSTAPRTPLTRPPPAAHGTSPCPKGETRMCITVRRSTAPVVTLRPWDPATLTITIPAGLGAAAAITAVRAVLTELAIPQPVDGAVCCCGQPLRLSFIPVQRTIEEARCAS